MGTGILGEVVVVRGGGGGGCFTAGGTLAGNLQPTLFYTRWQKNSLPFTQKTLSQKLQSFIALINFP